MGGLRARHRIAGPLAASGGLAIAISRWTVPLMPVQALGLALRRRWVATFPRLYHRCCCRILGIRVRAIGRPVAVTPGAVRGQPHLLSRYHGAGLAARRLVSSPRREVAGWPLFGWLARLQRSVFIDRRVRSTAQPARRASPRGSPPTRRLILFPGGHERRRQPRCCRSRARCSASPISCGRASGPVDGAAGLDRLYPARRHAARAALRPLFAWYGSMSLAPHLWRCWASGRLEVVVEFHPPTTSPTCGSRKTLARYCEERVAAGSRRALSGRREPADAVPTAPEPRLPTDRADADRLRLTSASSTWNGSDLPATLAGELNA